MRSSMAPKGGFTLVEIMIVVAILGLLATMAIPAFVRARTQAQTRACNNNLRQIEAAKQMWGMENGKSSTDVPDDTDLVGPTLYLRQRPICPAGGSYNFNQVMVAPTCTTEGHTVSH